MLVGWSTNRSFIKAQGLQYRSTACERVQIFVSWEGKRKKNNSLQRSNIDWWIGGVSRMRWQWVMQKKVRAAFDMWKHKETNWEMSKKSDRFKGPPFTITHTCLQWQPAKEFWAIVFDHFWAKIEIAKRNVFTVVQWRYRRALQLISLATPLVKR